MHSTTSTSIEKLNELRDRATTAGQHRADQASAPAACRRSVRDHRGWPSPRVAVARGARRWPSTGGIGRRRAVADRLPPRRGRASASRAAERADRSERRRRGRTEPTPPRRATGAGQGRPRSAPAARPPPGRRRSRRRRGSARCRALPLSSCFGPRWGTMHKGIDFAGADGTPIRAVGAGTVVAAGWNYTGYGISVVIDHGNGYLTHYAHASEVLVSRGQKVEPGQPIAHRGQHRRLHRPAPALRDAPGACGTRSTRPRGCATHGVTIGC